MDTGLRNAAERGDTDALYGLIRQLPNVLRFVDDYDFVDTPLHIAAARGHTDFTTAILNLKPSLARKLNQDVYSLIHLAFQNGHENTVLRLLEADKDLVHVKGKEGYTVLHQAAERGNLQLLAEFLKNCPSSIEDVTIHNETALHIAAKNSEVEAVELLARWLQRSHLYSKVSRKHILNSKDADGNTVLHIAASPIQTQMIKILVECGADRMATNMYGMTTLDIIKNQRINTQDRAMGLKILQCGGAGFSCLRTCFNPGVQPLHKLLRSKISFCERQIMGIKISWLSPERVNVLLVVLSLILTSTLQGVQNPPGGVWQGDPTDQSGNSTDIIGTSVMSSEEYFVFTASNLLLFTVSLIITYALLHFVTAGSAIMFLFQILFSSFTVCFLIALYVVTPDDYVELKSNGLDSRFGIMILMFIPICNYGVQMLSLLPRRYQIFINYFHEE